MNSVSSSLFSQWFNIRLSTLWGLGFLLFSLLLTATEAQGGCSTPAGVAGQLQIVSGSPRYCDGSTWLDPAVNVQLSCLPAQLGQIQMVSGDAQICDGSFWYSIVGTATEPCTLAEIGTLTWRGTHKKMQYCDGFNWHVPYTAASPVVSSLNINSGATSTINNNIDTALSASVADSQSVLTHFCYKYTTGSSVPAAPLLDDSCWLAFDSPSPGLTLASGLSFSGHFHQIGFTEGTYTLYAWVMTSAGQISTLSNTGLGTDGVDKKEILYQPKPPPLVQNILSANSDDATFPLSSADTTAAAGTTVYVKWQASSTTGFGATPISLYYTEDEISFTLIASNISHGANTGCTVDGSTFNGCYTWTNGSPTSGYFRVRVEAEDTVGATSFNTGHGMNTGSFSNIAGNTNTGLGGLASNAVIFNHVDQISQDAKSMVVAPDGTFYIRDTNHGVMKIDPTNGLYNAMIPYTGTITDGAIGVATLGQRNARLTMDYDGNLIIYDHTRIRKVDLSTNTVYTLVGGGATVANGTNALDFSLACAVTSGERCPLTVLPNGDMYFLRRPSRSGKPSTGEAIWHYDQSDGKVYSIVPSGTGAAGIPSLDISDSFISGVYLIVDPTTSNVEKLYGAFWEDPCVGCGPRYRAAELDQSTYASQGPGFSSPSSSYYSQITAMDGKLYIITTSSNIFRYDEVLNSWTHLFGSGTFGVCADGTDALTCDSQIQDAFVTAQGNIYFLDRGTLRTIDDSNQVVTVSGQRRTFGDGGLAVSARFNEIRSIAETTSGKVAVLDRKEHLIREFTVGGNINRLIGTGKTSGVSDGIPGTSAAAPAGYWGNSYNIVYDDSNENLYFYSGSSIYRYQRSDGNVYQAVGHGGTTFDVADGLVGSSIQVGGYPEIIIGFNGSHLLLTSNYWNGSSHERSFLKMYDINDSYRQSQLAGQLATAGSLPSDGTSLATAPVPAPFSSRYKMGSWDPATSSWLIAEGNRIRTLPQGGNIGTLTTLPRTPSTWTITKNASLEWVVYYCSSGRVYKYNVTTTTETALPWPSSTISCGGGTMHRSPSRNSVVFPYTQNGLWAVGEIVDTP